MASWIADNVIVLAVVLVVSGATYLDMKEHGALRGLALPAVALAASATVFSASVLLGDYQHFREWKGTWGQLDACVGYYSAAALEQGADVSFEEIHAVCENLVINENGWRFYLGYPVERWEATKGSPTGRYASS